MGYLDEFNGAYNDSDSSGGPTPVGEYATKCEDAQIKFWPSGEPFIELRCRVAIGPRKGDALWLRLGFDERSMPWTKGAVVAILGEAHSPGWLEANLKEWVDHGITLAVVENKKRPEYPYINFRGAAELPVEPSAEDQLDKGFGATDTEYTQASDPPVEITDPNHPDYIPF